MMGADYGAVDDEVLHVGLIDEMLMHTFPYPAITPAGEPLVDAVPIAIGGWEHPPLRTGARHPQHALDETLAIGLLSNVQSGLAAKKRTYLCPLFGR